MIVSVIPQDGDGVAPYRWTETNLTYKVGDFSEVMLQAIYAAGEAWMRVANITFTPSDDPVIWVRSSEKAETYLPLDTENGGDVYLPDAPKAVPGSLAYFLALHEIGHALGLIHTDTSVYTSVMSYADYVGDTVQSSYWSSMLPMTPMLEDIANVQSMYGANLTTNAGDTVYQAAVGQKFYLTIWDAGGMDTLDWSNQSTPAILDLREGYSSHVGPMRFDGQRFTNENLWIADGVIIENAKGGSGDDVFYLNDYENVIDGGDGFDTVYASSIEGDVLHDIEQIILVGSEALA